MNRKRKPINWFLLGIIGLPLLAVGAYFWVTALMDSLYNYRSPLMAMPPQAGAPVGEPLTGRVVIVLIDALREDTSLDAEVMPFLNGLREQAAWATMSSRPPSFSAPGWITILTGAWPDINDSQPLNPPDENSVRTFTQDDIFAAAERSGLRTAISGYAWFEGMLANSGVDAGFYIPGEDNAADQDVVDAALPWLSENFQLVLVHIDQVDYAGHHEGGPRDPNWDAAANRSDALLAEIVNILDMEQDTVIVLSDHGQIDRGGHGGNESVVMTEPFVMAGKGIIPGKYLEIEMVDVAPTVAVLLGTNIPASNQGRPLIEMLEIDTAAVDAIQSALASQQADLYEAFTTAIGQEAEPIESETIVSATQLAMENLRQGKLARERVWRNLVAVFITVIPAYLLFLRKEKKALWFLAGTAIYLLLFLGRYILIDNRTLSLSSLESQTWLITYSAVTSALALAVAWLVSMLGLRAFRLGPREAARQALGFVWFTLYVLAIPILLSFAVNGYRVTWTLPEFTTQFLGFFATVQGLFVAVVGLLLVGISALATRVVKKQDKL